MHRQECLCHIGHALWRRHSCLWLGVAALDSAFLTNGVESQTLCNVESLLPRAFQRGRRCRQADEGAVLAMKLSVFTSLHRCSWRQSTTLQEPPPPHPPPAPSPPR